MIVSIRQEILLVLRVETRETAAPAAINPYSTCAILLARYHAVVSPVPGTPCDEEKDIDCLMQDEDLILVNKKKSSKAKQDKAVPKLLVQQYRHEAVKEGTHL